MTSQGYWGPILSRISRGYLVTESQTLALYLIESHKIPPYLDRDSQTLPQYPKQSHNTFLGIPNSPTIPCKLIPISQSYNISIWNLTVIQYLDMESQILLSSSSSFNSCSIILSFFFSTLKHYIFSITQSNCSFHFFYYSRCYLTVNQDITLTRIILLLKLFIDTTTSSDPSGVSVNSCLSKTNNEACQSYLTTEIHGHILYTGNCV